MAFSLPEIEELGVSLKQQTSTAVQANSIRNHYNLPLSED